MAVGTDQVVVVTGASAGLGRAVACAFAQRRSLCRRAGNAVLRRQPMMSWRGVDARWGSPRMSPIRNR